MNKLITIFGNSGSGKTSLAAKLATELSAKNHNVILVSTDFKCPTGPVLVPNPGDKGKSLGKVLSAVNVAQSTIMQNCIAVDNNVAVLAYGLSENTGSYIEVTPDKALDFIRNIKYLADYVIVDCQTDIEADNLGLAAIPSSDLVIRMLTPDTKGMSYLSSVIPRLQTLGVKLDHTLNVLSNIKEYSAFEDFDTQQNGTKMFIFNSKKLEREMIESKLFSKVTSKDKANNKTIGSLVNLITTS